VPDKTIVLLAFAQITVWASLYYVFPAMLLYWEADFGWTRTQLTGALTTAALLSAVVSPLVGRLIDRGFAPIVMTGSTLTGAVCLFLLSRVDSLLEFYGIWVVIGIALAGCLYEPSFALITRARGAAAKRSIMQVTIMAGFAGTISFPFTHAVSSAYGWTTAVQSLSAGVVFLGVPLMWLSSNSLEAQVSSQRRLQGQKKKTDHAFLRDTRIWYLALSFALLAILHGVALHHLLPILSEKGVSTELAVLVASLIGPMQVAGRLVMALTSVRISNRVQASASFVLLGISIVALMASAYSEHLVFVFVALFGGAYGTVSILRPVITREVLGERDFGSKYGVVASIYLAGGAAGPVLGSLFWLIGGYDLVLPCISLLAVLALILYLIAANARI